jgi:hypothetical protein
MISKDENETLTLVDDSDPSRVQVLPGLSPAEQDAAILAFFGPPPVVRTLVRKSTVIRRCHEAGVLAAVMAILDHPSNAYAKARWWAPDWPEVFADDPEMVAMLTAVGADVAVITAPEEGA